MRVYDLVFHFPPSNHAGSTGTMMVYNNIVSSCSGDAIAMRIGGDEVSSVKVVSSCTLEDRISQLRKEATEESLEIAKELAQFLPHYS